jgi:hypothetical protein
MTESPRTEEVDVMRAVTFTQFGGPDVLTVDERPIPEVPAGHVRVRVQAAAVPSVAPAPPVRDPYAT